MKKLPIVYLGKAQLDLIDILKYIEKDSPAHVQSWIDRIDRSIGHLAAFPSSGVIPKDERLAAQGYRIVVIGEYLAFYVVRRNRIEIRRVLQGSRRYSFLL